MYNKTIKQQLAQERKERFARIARVDKRINRMNDIASHEDAEFTKLTAFAKAHPIIFLDVMHAYILRPNDRFGDTLLMFCDSVKYGRIKLEEETSNEVQ
jgi:hypothetical protein